jgi:hypothetical protein
MPEFDANRLSGPERAAWLERLERDGRADVDSMFATVIWWVGMLRDEGKGPTEITERIGGEYHDAELKVMPGPTIRYQTIALTRAMVRQALELGPPTP